MLDHHVCLSTQPVSFRIESVVVAWLTPSMVLRDLTADAHQFWIKRNVSFVQRSFEARLNYLGRVELHVVPFIMRSSGHVKMSGGGRTRLARLDA
jgi:hypothetical protein